MDKDLPESPPPSNGGPNLGITQHVKSLNAPVAREDDLGSTLMESQTPSSYPVASSPKNSGPHKDGSENGPPSFAPTREPTDLFATLSAKQDHLEQCMEKWIGNIMEHQTKLECIFIESFGRLREGGDSRHRGSLTKGHLRTKTSIALRRAQQRAIKKHDGDRDSVTGGDYSKDLHAFCSNLREDEIASEGDLIELQVQQPNAAVPMTPREGNGAHIEGLPGISSLGPSAARKPTSEKLPVMPLPPEELDIGDGAGSQDPAKREANDEDHEKLPFPLEVVQNVLAFGKSPEKPSDEPETLAERISQQIDAQSRVSGRTSFRTTVPSSEQQAADKILTDIKSVGASTPAQQLGTATSDRRKKTLKKQTGEEMMLLPWYVRLLENSIFDTGCALVIVLNSVLIGWSVEHMTKNDEEAPATKILNNCCNVFFLLELLLRMWVHGKEYFTCEDKKWNIFDFLLVTVSVVDFIMLDVAKLGAGGAGQVGSGLKILKMLRIVRIFRVFRFFKELSLLALMIMDSLKSLMWALLMLTIIIYVFAICFTQGATDHLKAVEDSANRSENDAEIWHRFGSLSRTTYSLVQAMLDGKSWGTLSDALMSINVFMPTLFFFYIAFTMLAVLNIITGVFVDNAVETAKTEREFLVQKEMELKEKYVQEMRDLFGEMDTDGSGTITAKELAQYFSDARVQSYFQALGLDPSDTERLFNLLDDDGSGEVSADEFLDGCLRLKGQARSIDVHTIMYECKRINARLEGCENKLGVRREPAIKDSEISTGHSVVSFETPEMDDE